MFFEKIEYNSCKIELKVKEVIVNLFLSDVVLVRNYLVL